MISTGDEERRRRRAKTERNTQNSKELKSDDAFERQIFVCVCRCLRTYVLGISGLHLLSPRTQERSSTTKIQPTKVGQGVDEREQTTCSISSYI